MEPAVSRAFLLPPDVLRQKDSNQRDNSVPRYSTPSGLTDVVYRKITWGNAWVPGGVLVYSP